MVFEPLDGFGQQDGIRFGELFERDFGIIDPGRRTNDMLLRYKQQPPHHGRRVLGIIKVADNERIRNQMHCRVSIDEPCGWSRNTSGGSMVYENQYNQLTSCPVAESKTPLVYCLPISIHNSRDPRTYEPPDHRTS
jgi:hypothetical protein